MESRTAAQIRSSAAAGCTCKPQMQTQQSAALQRRAHMPGHGQRLAHACGGRRQSAHGSRWIGLCTGRQLLKSHLSAPAGSAWQPVTQRASGSTLVSERNAARQVIRAWQYKGGDIQAQEALTSWQGAWRYLKVHNFCIQMSLKFERQLSQLKYTNLLERG